MKTEDFVTFADLKTKFTIRNKTENKEPVDFAKAVTFTFSCDEPMKLRIKHSYSGSEITVNLCPRGQRGSVSSALFTQKYESKRKIDASKMKDINSLKDYIPKVYWDRYYSNLAQGRRCEGELDEDPIDITGNVEAQETLPNNTAD